MADPKFKKGYVHTGVNKTSGSNNVSTLGAALKELAGCDPCGCDKTLCFWTQTDLSTGNLVLAFVYEGSVLTVVDNAANRALFAACCAERSAGGATPSCASLGSIYVPTYAPTYSPTYIPTYTPTYTPTP